MVLSIKFIAKSVKLKHKNQIARECVIYLVWVWIEMTADPPKCDANIKNKRRERKPNLSKWNYKCEKKHEFGLLFFVWWNKKFWACLNAVDTVNLNCHLLVLLPIEKKRKEMMIKWTCERFRVEISRDMWLFQSIYVTMKSLLQT